MSWFDTVVIVVEGSGPTGGAERVAFETVELLSERGFKVRVISSSNHIDQKFLELPGVEGVSLSLPLVWDTFFSRNRIASFPLRRGDKSLIPKFQSAFAGLDPNSTVVHVHGFHSHFSHLILSVPLDLGFDTHLHAHDYGYVCPNATLFHYPSNSICRVNPLSKACKESDCLGTAGANLKRLRFNRAEEAFASQKIYTRLKSILCPSPFARAVMAKSLGDLVRLQVLRCPVQPASNARVRAEESQNYLWIGRITAEKNPDVAFAAARAAGIVLNVIGDGPLRAELEEKFPEHKFVGWKSPKEVSELQRGARCLIMSSAWYETASLVVLECLAAGVPCVIGRESAATSWVTDGQNGLYFENGSVESLTAQLMKLKEDNCVSELSTNAFTRYWADPCTSTVYINNLLEVFSKR